MPPNEYEKINKLCDYVIATTGTEIMERKEYLDSVVLCATLCRNLVAVHQALEQQMIINKALLNRIRDILK